MLPVGLVVLGVGLRDIAIRKSPRYDAYRKKYVNTMWNNRGVKIGIATLFSAIYATVFTQFYAQVAADRVKSGKGPRVMLVRNDGVTSGEKPILLGSTTKFFFLYYPGRRETEIVPVENVSHLTVDSRMRRERERDSLATLGVRR